MRKIILTVVVVVATALTSAACGARSSGPGDSNEPIKVGAWLPLTGAAADSGIETKTGIDAFFKQLNDEGGIGGRDVEFIVGDDAYDPQQTLQVARRLVQQENVVAFLGSFGTANAEAAFPFVLDQSEVPIVAPIGGVREWYTEDHPGLYLMYPTTVDAFQAAGAWAAEDGAKKVLILHWDSEIFKAAADAAAEPLTAAGAEVQFMPVKIGTADYAPIVAQIPKYGPDSVVVISGSIEVATYLKESKRQGLEVRNYTFPQNVSLTIPNLAGADADGLKGISAVRSPLLDEPGIVKYREAMAKYAPDHPIDYTSLQAYAYAYAFAEVVKGIDGEITAETINTAFENAEGINTGGILSPLKFSSEDRFGVDTVFRNELVNGKWVDRGEARLTTGGGR